MELIVNNWQVLLFASMIALVISYKLVQGFTEAFQSEQVNKLKYYTVKSTLGVSPFLVIIISVLILSGI